MPLERLCVLCWKQMGPNTPVVEIHGGFFLVDDPDFFVADEAVMPIRHAHKDCLTKHISTMPPAGES